MSHLLIDQVVYEALRVYYYFIFFNDKNGGLDKPLLYSFATRKFPLSCIISHQD